VLLLSATTATAAALLLAATTGSSVLLVLAVLEPGNRIPATVIGADTGRARRVAAAIGSSTATSLDSKLLVTGMLDGGGGVDLGALKTGAGVGEGGNRGFEDLGLKFVLITQTIDELKSEVVVVDGATDGGEAVHDPL
jgi:hypothetical protein